MIAVQKKEKPIILFDSTTFFFSEFIVSVSALPYFSLA